MNIFASFKNYDPKKTRSGLQLYFFILGMVFFVFILNQYFHFDRAGDGFSAVIHHT